MQYLPVMLGMFLLMWLFQIQIGVQRIAPFIGMASYSAKARSEAPLMEEQPTNFLLPKLFYFRGGQPDYRMHHDRVLATDFHHSFALSLV